VTLIVFMQVRSPSYPRSAANSNGQKFKQGRKHFKWVLRFVPGGRAARAWDWPLMPIQCGG